jgi:hypothetical protein
MSLCVVELDQAPTSLLRQAQPLLTYNVSMIKKSPRTGKVAQSDPGTRSGSVAAEVAPIIRHLKLPAFYTESCQIFTQMRR